MNLTGASLDISIIRQLCRWLSPNDLRKYWIVTLFSNQKKRLPNNLDHQIITEFFLSDSLQAARVQQSLWPNFFRRGLLQDNNALFTNSSIKRLKEIDLDRCNSDLSLISKLQAAALVLAQKYPHDVFLNVFDKILDAEEKNHLGRFLFLKNRKAYYDTNDVAKEMKACFELTKEKDLSALYAKIMEIIENAHPKDFAIILSEVLSLSWIIEDAAFYHIAGKLIEKIDDYYLGALRETAVQFLQPGSLAVWRGMWLLLKLASIKKMTINDHEAILITASLVEKFEEFEEFEEREASSILLPLVLALINHLNQNQMLTLLKRLVKLSDSNKYVIMWLVMPTVRLLVDKADREHLLIIKEILELYREKNEAKYLIDIFLLTEVYSKILQLHSQEFLAQFLHETLINICHMKIAQDFLDARVVENIKSMFDIKDPALCRCVFDIFECNVCIYEIPEDSQIFIVHCFGKMAESIDNNLLPSLETALLEILKKHHRRVYRLESSRICWAAIEALSRLAKRCGNSSQMLETLPHVFEYSQFAEYEEVSALKVFSESIKDSDMLLLRLERLLTSHRYSSVSDNYVNEAEITILTALHSLPKKTISETECSIKLFNCFQLFLTSWEQRTLGEKRLVLFFNMLMAINPETVLNHSIFALTQGGPAKRVMKCFIMLMQAKDLECHQRIIEAVLQEITFIIDNARSCVADPSDISRFTERCSYYRELLLACEDFFNQVPKCYWELIAGTLLTALISVNNINRNNSKSIATILVNYLTKFMILAAQNDCDFSSLNDRLLCVPPSLYSAILKTMLSVTECLREQRQVEEISLFKPAR